MLDKAIDIVPDVPELWLTKAMVLSEIDKPDEALLCYERVIQLDPSNYVALDGAGVILTNKGDHARALQYYDRALHILGL